MQTAVGDSKRTNVTGASVNLAFISREFSPRFHRRRRDTGWDQGSDAWDKDKARYKIQDKKPRRSWM